VISDCNIYFLQRLSNLTSSTWSLRTTQGQVIAHSDPGWIGRTYGTELDVNRISELETVEWRQVSDLEGSQVFEVFRRFAPTQPPPGGS
jgi:hypothetical protein